jgi:hypothetical protein
MSTKIEMGSFNRSASSPIFLKEKIESDGSSSVRIYQRKDIDSIASFKDKIKTMMKYGIEDFCTTHGTFRPLLGAVGIKRIDHLKTNDLKSAQDLLKSIRSEARTGKVTEEKEKELKKILGDHGLSDDYKINFYEGQYKTEDFFSDLNRFLSSEKKFTEEDKVNLSEFESAFKYKKIVKQVHLDSQKETIEKVKKSLEKHFDNQIRLSETQPGESTNSSETRSAGGSRSYLETLQKELERKLNKIEREVAQRSIAPKDEDIKNYLLLSIQRKLDDSGAWNDETTRETAEIQATIDILFSTSWWISEERKLESLKKVQGFFKEDYQWLPEPVKNRIYPEQKSVSVSPLSNPQRRTTDDDTTLESLGKIQNFSENNQGLLSGAVTHGIYTDRKLKTSPSTGNPQRKTTEDDD